ncbi:Glucose-1-phosphate thymidylyltransferase [Streptomyces alboniger]
MGDGSLFGIKVTYIPQEAPLGLAHAVLIAQDFLGDDDFVMYLGDNFIVGGITGLVGTQFRAERPEAQILLTKVPNPTSFGVAELAATAGWWAWRRSRRSRRATWPWSACTCSRR